MLSRFRYQLALVLAIGLILGGLSSTTQAAESKTDSKKTTENITQSVTQSYSAGPEVQLGMIVSLKPKQTGFVEPLSQDSFSAMLGVIVKPNDSTITLSPQGATTQQVFVARTGRYLTLVSNQNGPIKPGDYISISAVAGVGMKADANQNVILGKAVTAFNGSSNVIGKVTVKDQKGRPTDVSITRMNVELAINRNPLATRQTDKVPAFLVKSAAAVAGKPVSTARIYLGTVVLIVSAVIASIVVWSGVRSGMIAIGRNPLSKKSIFGSLIQTVIAGLIIFVVGIFAVYLLLAL